MKQIKGTHKLFANCVYFVWKFLSSFQMVLFIYLQPSNAVTSAEKLGIKIISVEGEWKFNLTIQVLECENEFFKEKISSLLTLFIFSLS